MNSYEIVVDKMDRLSIAVVLDFFREPIGFTDEPSHAHSHGQVLALYIISGNVLRVWFSCVNYSFCPTVLFLSLGRIGVFRVRVIKLVNLRKAESLLICRKTFSNSIYIGF